MQVYIVQKGDTLWNIAKKYRITVEDILKVNPQITNPDRIYPGQAINIPVGAPGGSTGGGFIYTVVAGDTMWSIAQRYGISLDQLIRANPQIKDPNVINIGQKIFVPVGGPSPCSTTYTVVSGDTMWLIAKRFGISLNDLIRANPQIPNPNLIYPGQVLNIPRSCVHPMPPTPPGPPVPPTPPVDKDVNGKLYYVKSGDTFFNIAQRFGINMDSLIRANPHISNPARINVGMQIYLPGIHYVRSGETLFSIAQRYNVVLEDLIAVNPQITNPNNIVVGQKVYIPMAPRAIMAHYTVRSGDTLYRIAQRYNVPIDAIVMANNIQNPDMIFPGQVLIIPGPHIVEQGQSLASIASLYGKSLAAVIKCNPQITNPNLIYPGQHVVIPIDKRSAEDFDIDESYDCDDCAEMCDRANTNSVTHPMIYTVKPGDTLYSIANKYKVTVKQILMANPSIKNADMIYPGDNILILPVNMVCEYRCMDCPWLKSGIDE